GWQLDFALAGGGRNRRKRCFPGQITEARRSQLLSPIRVELPIAHDNLVRTLFVAHGRVDSTLLLYTGRGERGESHRLFVDASAPFCRVSWTRRVHALRVSRDFRVEPLPAKVPHRRRTQPFGIPGCPVADADRARVAGGRQL